jgi:hypothetical protein
MTTLPLVMDVPPVTPRLLRPLLGSGIIVRTRSATVRGTLLSCVKNSAWLVVEDDDVVVPLDDMVAVWAC